MGLIAAIKMGKALKSYGQHYVSCQLSASYALGRKHHSALAFLPSLGRLVVITLLLSEGELVNSFLVVLSRERQKLKKLNHYHFRTSKICTAGSIHLMGIPVAALNLIL